MASKSSTTLALALDRRMDRLIARAVARSRSVGARAMRAALEAVRQQASPTEAAVTIITRQLTPIVQAVSLLTHLQGREFVDRQTRGRMPVEAQVVPLGDPVFEGAANTLAARLNVPEAALADLRTKYGPIAINATNGVNRELERSVQQHLAAATRAGPVTTREGVRVVGQAFTSAGLSPAKPFLLETIYRTQLQLAFNAGRQNALRDPFIQEVLWGFEYVTVGDDRVRDNHAALDRLRRPKSDPIWQSIIPPNGFNCRCQVIEIFTDQTELATSTPLPDKVEIDGKTVTPVPDPGFSFNPGSVATDIINRAVPTPVAIKTTAKGPTKSKPTRPRKPVTPPLSSTITDPELRKDARKAERKIKAVNKRLAKARAELDRLQRLPETVQSLEQGLARVKKKRAQLAKLRDESDKRIAALRAKLR